MRTKLFGLLVVAALLPASRAHAGCETVASVTSDLWKKYGTVATTVAAAAGPAGQTAATAAKITDEMIHYWNDMAGNSWAKIGPRRLDFSGDNKGTVESVGDRQWVSAAPATGPLTISFKKTDGNGTARVTVCTVDKSNKHTVVKTFDVDKDDQDGKTWSIPVGDAKDHLVIVVVDGKNVVKKVGYAFTAQ